MRIIVGSGKVANVIRQKDDVILSHSAIEVKDYNSVESALSKYENEDVVVINTVSKINLEWCEENPDETYDVNTNGAINIANVCKKFNYHLVHVSSGCIFDGNETEKAYTELDAPTPVAVYTKSKAEADFAIQGLYPKITIVRPRQLISAISNPTNMITKFASMKSGDFITSKNSITCIEDMGEMIQHLIAWKYYGIYNLANVGYISPYYIAQCVKEKLNHNMIVNPIEYETFVSGLKVKRVNTILDIDKLISTGYTPRHAIDALSWCISNYGTSN